jgi:hypothetical protein
MSIHVVSAHSHVAYLCQNQLEASLVTAMVLHRITTRFVCLRPKMCRLDDKLVKLSALLARAPPRLQRISGSATHAGSTRHTWQIFKLNAS